MGSLAHRFRLGRRYAPDARDRNHLLPLTRRRASAVTAKYWTSPGVLDQGKTSQCVVFASDKWLTTGPVYNAGFKDRTAIYKQCQRADEWPGENYDGTSVRAAFKVMQGMGLVASYQWAFTTRAVVDHLLVVGPVVMGTNWTEDMFSPDAAGYVHPTGQSAGGHAWCVIGANRTKQNPDKTVGAIRAINSWGSSWGDGGRFWVSFADLDKLIKANGEACTAVEVKK